jgi:uncharacterized Zn ribbon protein
MSKEKMIFVKDKYYAELEKGDMIRLPFQVIRDLQLKKGERIEFEEVKIAEGDDFIQAFTIVKHEK